MDKTGFIKEWWENGDAVTLITRPRRFGKTLTMDMVKRFFSVDDAKNRKMFQGLSIWEEEKYRKLQGTYPVIFLSFADIKEASFAGTRENDAVAAHSLKALSHYLARYYGKKVIILLDEYDTPLQEAYMSGYWEELTEFIRGLFNAAFKTNPDLYRAIMTGITRVSKESVFSDLNNLEVMTTTSEKYETCFGFTQEEVWEALAEYGLSEQEQSVRDWYDGFTFGRREDIYNPWSIINYLDKRHFSAYWANTSSNSLVGKLIQEGDRDIKTAMESLLRGESLHVRIDEQIMFEEMIEGWFSEYRTAYNDFIKALLLGDIEAMNHYMNQVTRKIFSYFDTGKELSEEAEPERFHHGFVLGLMVELTGRYVITSNRESGFGRYDVMLEPLEEKDPAIILEFKVWNIWRVNTVFPGDGFIWHIGRISRPAASG